MSEWQSPRTTTICPFRGQKMMFCHDGSLYVRLAGTVDGSLDAYTRFIDGA